MKPQSKCPRPRRATSPLLSFALVEVVALAAAACGVAGVAADIDRLRSSRPAHTAPSPIGAGAGPEAAETAMDLPGSPTGSSWDALTRRQTSQP